MHTATITYRPRHRAHTNPIPRWILAAAGVLAALFVIPFIAGWQMAGEHQATGELPTDLLKALIVIVAGIVVVARAG